MSIIIWLTIILFLAVALAISIYCVISLQAQIESLGEVRKWKRLAFKDDLTGLFNRAAFNQRMDDIHAGDKNDLGIILFDIDDFKEINDTQGHLIGDAVLRKTGWLLSEIFASSAYDVYRIGGDEFAVIGERVSAYDLKALIIETQSRFEQEGGIHLSTGCAMIGKNVAKAFNDADSMLYAEKAAKR